MRHEQPRVRRSRSTSTRTQSIRRTSLREKMNTTKKDVQDEKLYFIQSFDAMPKNEPVRTNECHIDDITVLIARLVRGKLEVAGTEGHEQAGKADRDVVPL